VEQGGVHWRKQPGEDGSKHHGMRNVLMLQVLAGRFCCAGWHALHRMDAAG
jgi:hypothetical protein